MTFTDTHTHLYLKDFKEDIGKVIENALQEGVSRMYLPAIDSTETANLEQLESSYPEICFAMTGLHPCSVKGNVEEELFLVEESLKRRKYSAIGETGLDFYWDLTFMDNQYDSFRKQIALALAYKLPVVIHTRQAMDEAIGVVKEYSGTGLKGIFHCFGGTLQQARQIIDEGFYLGIGGVVTYKNSGLSEVLPHIDIRHIVLETDAPYLTPVPFRGKRNESSYIKYVAAKLAEIMGIPVEEIARITTENAARVYN